MKSLLIAFAASLAVAQEKVPVVWNATGFDAPESACYDDQSGALFVSNVGGSPGEKDGKGWISKAGLDGKIVAEKWVSGLNAPKGMRIHKGTLWVSDIDAIVSIDIAKGAVLKRHEIEGAKFLNDVACGPDGTVYVSDMATSTIFALAEGRVSVLSEGADLEHPNGLLVEGGRLIVAAWGKPEADFSTKTPGRLFAVDLKTRAKTLITASPTGNLDGVESDGKGGYVVTDWVAGKVLHIAGDGTTRTLLQLAKGAADLAFVASRNLLILPRMLENVVTAYDLTAGLCGVDPAKLAPLRAKLQEFVDQNVVSGAVTLVGRRGHVVSLEAVGVTDLEKKTPMKADTIFRIASMTKPITAIGIMMLEDEGKLKVEDPVEKHLPEFQGQMLKGGTVKPARPITLRDLLTHTSGLNGSPPPEMKDLYSKRNRTLAEAVPAFAKRPLEFEPGSKWSYCNTGIDTLGRVIEVVSGKSYEAFLEERLFKPLGMKETFFYPQADRVDRIAHLHRSDKGKLVVVENFLGDQSEGKYPIPAGGLFSTAPDLAKLYQLMLDGGRKLLSEASIAKMTRLQTGDLKCGFTSGMGFGFGWAVVRTPEGVTEMLSPGTYGHGGAFGTQGWIDPKKEMYFILMIQRVGLPNADASDIRKALQSIAVSAITD